MAGNVGQSASEEASVSTVSESTTTSTNVTRSIISYGAETFETINGVVTGVRGDGVPQGTVNVTYGANSTPLCSATLVPNGGNASTYKCAIGSATQLAAGSYLSVRAHFVPATASSSNGAYSYTSSSSVVLWDDSFLVVRTSRCSRSRCRQTRSPWGRSRLQLLA